MFRIVGTILSLVLSQLFIAGVLALLYGIIFGFSEKLIWILAGVSVLLVATLIALKILCDNAPGTLSDNGNKENKKYKGVRKNGEIIE